MLIVKFLLTFCIAAGVDFENRPVAMHKRKLIIKLPICVLERVQPQTEADRVIQLKFVCPAPYFAKCNVGGGYFV